MAAIYRTWADGDAFTAEDAGDYFMRQALIACDNQTDRDAILTPNEGLHVYRKDTDAIEIYDGTSWLTYDSTWQSYTPLLYGGATLWTIGNGTATGRVFKQGKKVSFFFDFYFGSTSSLPAGTLQVASPTTMDNSVFGSFMPDGRVQAVNSGIANTVGACYPISSSKIGLCYDIYGATVNSAPTTAMTNTTPYTPGSGDRITGVCNYFTA